MGISKKLFISLLLIVGSASLLSLPAYADCAGVQTVIVNCDAGTSNNGVWALLLIVINVLSAGVGIAAVGGIAYAALLYTTAGGNQSQVAKAIGMIRNTVIGIVCFAGGYAFLGYIIPGGFLHAINGAPTIVNQPPPSHSGGGSGTTPAKPPKVTSFTPSQVLIVGDSITARAVSGGNHGNKGWWQYLLAHKSGMFKFSAQGGSGYVTRGNEDGGRGNGTTFYQRLGDINTIKPKAIIIAGGINDRGNPRASAGIKAYYDKLEKILKTNNISTDNVYVFVPRLAGTAEIITQFVKTNAKRIGVHYIDVASYTKTYDGLHPTSASAQGIEQSFLAGSDFGSRLK